MRPGRGPLLWTCALAALPIAIGLAAPSDLDLHDQARQALYVVDVVDGGSWLAPRDPRRITTKPPLYTWLAVAAAESLGLDEFAVELPSRLAWLGLALVTFALGRQFLGTLAGVVAVGLLATLESTLKLANLVRTDMLLALWIALAMLAFARGARGAFWLASAAGALTKGPIGMGLPLLAAALDAALRRDASKLRTLRPAVGLPVALMLFGTWLLAALRSAPDDLWEVLVRTEVFERMTGEGKFTSLQKPLWYLLPYLVMKLVPTSLFAPVSLVREAWPSEREGRSLLWAWLIAGVVLVSLPATKRPDHLYPVYPAAALLAAGVLAHWARAEGCSGRDQALGAGVLAWCAVLALGTCAISVAFATDLAPRLPRPPRWALLAGPLALAPLGIAIAWRRSRIPLLACAIAAQAIFLTLFPHVFTPIAREHSAAQVRGFAREVDRLVGDEAVAFHGVGVHSVKFLLRRNAVDLSRAAVSELAAQPGPHWLVISGAARAAFEADGTAPRAEVVARSGCLRSFQGDELLLVRIFGRASSGAGRSSSALPGKV